MTASSLMRVVAVALLSVCTAAQAEEDPDVFARMGDTVVTHELLDAAFSRIDERYRLEFIRNPEKTNDLLKQIMISRRLADAARGAAFDEDPMIRGRLELAADKELAEAWLDHLVKQAPDADYEQLAKEYFLVNREQFMTELTYDVTHLLISTSDTRPEAEAESIAADLLQQVESDPAQFDQLVIEHSDDPSVSANQGKFAGVRLGQMVAPFEQAALALEEPGQFTGLVKTQFGFHIIRLDGKTEPRQQEFSEVRPGLASAQRRRYWERVRNRIIGEATSVPMEVSDEAVEKMLKRHFGENLELAPDYSN